MPTLARFATRWKSEPKNAKLREERPRIKVTLLQEARSPEAQLGWEVWNEAAKCSCSHRGPHCTWSSLPPMPPGVWSHTWSLGPEETRKQYLCPLPGT